VDAVGGSEPPALSLVDEPVPVRALALPDELQGATRAGLEGRLVTAAEPDGYAEVAGVVVPVRLRPPAVAAAPGQALLVTTGRRSRSS